MTKQKCILEMIALLVLAVLFAWGTALERQQQNIADSLIRLHVVGASDTGEAQEIKLQVRDSVLAEAEFLLEQAGTRQEAVDILGRNLSLLERAANQKLEELGCPDRAQVSLNRELFGTRVYETFSLPGGYYDALRVTIGSGEGKNWWCVVYPQICMATSVEQQQAVAVMGGMDGEDVKIIQGEYELKFKTLELFENLMGWFRTMGQGIPTSG